MPRMEPEVQTPPPAGVVDHSRAQKKLTDIQIARRKGVQHVSSRRLQTCQNETPTLIETH